MGVAIWAIMVPVCDVRIKAMRLSAVELSALGVDPIDRAGRFLRPH